MPRKSRSDVQQAADATPLPLQYPTAAHRDLAIITIAKTFTATVRGAGANQTLYDLPSLIEAGASALILERRFPTGRQAAVYAVTEHGQTAMVPRCYWLDRVGEALRALD